MDSHWIRPTFVRKFLALIKRRQNVWWSERKTAPAVAGAVYLFLKIN
jgi:hypothetical protein